MFKFNLENVMNDSYEKSIKIKRHPSEIPLFFIMLAVSLSLWIAMAMSIVVGIYVLLIGLFFLFGHVSMIAHIRGNAAQVNEEQFTELHQLVVTLSKQVGLKKIPEVYIMESGGVLNALATKFVKSKIIVIYSDLLDACDNNIDVIRMILGHEMGHIKSGHLRWDALLMPAMFIPFLGHAFSRAREYTCDRYGASVVEVKSNALLGLTILAVGKNYAANVSQKSLIQQSHNLNTGWMQIGEWLQSHPSLIKRIYALDPNKFKLVNKKISLWTSLKGFLIVFLIIGGISAATIMGVFYFIGEEERIAHKRASE